MRAKSRQHSEEAHMLRQGASDRFPFRTLADFLARPRCMPTVAFVDRPEFRRAVIFDIGDNRSEIALGCRTTVVKDSHFVEQCLSVSSAMLHCESERRIKLPFGHDSTSNHSRRSSSISPPSS